MLKNFLPIAAIMASPAFAEDTRQLDSHVHGVGKLNIAIQGTTVAMEFHAPGADIVGFEYAAKTDADHAKIDNAIKILSAPLEIFTLPASAACTLSEAHAGLEGEEEHHEEDHNENHDEHDHDDHSEDDHEDSEKHAEEAGHTEFHAEYSFNCETPTDLTEITFAYFDFFENAQELEIQIISASGAKAYEVTRSKPVLDLER